MELITKNAAPTQIKIRSNRIYVHIPPQYQILNVICRVQVPLPVGGCHGLWVCCFSLGEVRLGAQFLSPAADQPLPSEEMRVAAGEAAVKAAVRDAGLLYGGSSQMSFLHWCVGSNERRRGQAEENAAEVSFQRKVWVLLTCGWNLVTCSCKLAC